MPNFASAIRIKLYTAHVPIIPKISFNTPPLLFKIGAPLAYIKYKPRALLSQYMVITSAAKLTGISLLSAHAAIYDNGILTNVSFQKVAGESIQPMKNMVFLKNGFI